MINNSLIINLFNLTLIKNLDFILLKFLFNLLINYFI